MKKQFLSLLLAAAILTTSALPASAAAPKIKKTEYDGRGMVEVEFRSEWVNYKNPRIVVKNAAGKTVKAYIMERDDEDLKFYVNNITPGTRYTYTISGVRNGRRGSYGSVSGSFSTPSSKPSIQFIEYDRYDREMDIDFLGKVQYRNLKVTVKDSSGRAVAVRRVERDDDSLEVKLSGLVSGKTYTVSVSGVRARNQGSYVTVSKKYTCR